MENNKATTSKENALILTSVPLNEITDIIRHCLRDELNKTTPSKNDNSDGLLTTKEAADFLKKSKTTLSKWRNKGIIPFHRIASRIYFKKEELIEAMKSSEKFSKTK